MFENILVIVCAEDRDGDGAAHIQIRGLNWDGTEAFWERVVSTGLAPVSSSGRRYFTAAEPDVCVSENGNSIVVWEDDRDANGKWQIYARGFDASGNQSFSEMTVNSVASGQQKFPSVACSANGDFVVVWQDDQDENGYYQIYARGFNADGSEKFHDMVVNTVASGQQVYPSITQAATGEFFIVWADDRDENGYYQIYGRGFYSDGSSLFSERAVNSVASGQQLFPRIACTRFGYFIVVWQDDQDGDGKYDIWARGFDVHGNERFHDIRVNNVSSGQKTLPQIGVSKNGDFIVTWDDGRSGNEIYARGFNPNGSEKFPEFQVNPNSNKYQFNNQVAVAPDGEFAILWSHDAYSRPGDSQNPEVFLRTFNPDGTIKYPTSNLDYSDNTGEWINAWKVFPALRNFHATVSVTNAQLINANGCLPGLFNFIFHPRSKNK